jgi:hypothetical protein
MAEGQQTGQCVIDRWRNWSRYMLLLLLLLNHRAGVDVRKTNFHVSGLRFFSIEFRHVDFACRLKAFMRILLRTAFSLIQPWNDNIKSESLKVLCILQFIKQSTKSSFFQKVYLYQSWINIFISCLYKNKFKEMKYKTATGLS